LLRPPARKAQSALKKALGLGIFTGKPWNFDASVAAASKTNAGWVVGAGIEFAAWSNWRLRGEYLHVDLGSIDTTAPFTGPLAVAAPPCIGCATSTHTALRADIARAALNYRFGDTVYAKY
jgi:outer membrane immunogenic protein